MARRAGGVMAAYYNEIEPFAVGVEKGKPYYNSIIIANAKGPVKTIDDIKGKPFAFGDQASTSSHLAPRTLLAKKGLIGDGEVREQVGALFCV